MSRALGQARKGVRKGAWAFGALAFFALVAGIIQIAVLLYDYIRQKTTSKGLIALLMLVVIILLAALCTLVDYFRRKYTVHKPVNAILEGTEKIARGEFSTRFPLAHPYGKYDQYDLIAENLNAMAGELEKSEVLKNDFISNVSHELKTPLTVIQSYAGLLDKEDIPEAKRREYAASIRLATAKLSDLITNILRLNKLENQELKTEYALFDLTEALGESLLSFEESIEKKGLTIDCDLEEGVLLYSSKSYLDIVWSNLLSNAIKFTNAGGRVALSLKRQADRAIVAVRDSGCGISPEIGSRIFEKFYQADASRAQEGNGLGLALVKKVVDVLGGEIAVESEEGKGTSFTITLAGAQK